MRSWCVVVVVFFLLVTGTTFAHEQPIIRVGLVTGVSSAAVGGSGEWVLQSSTGVAATGAGGEVTIRAEGGNIVAGTTTTTGPLTLASSVGWVTVNGLPYRGHVEIRNSGGTLIVVNVLPLEQYLYGVVPREMPISWPAEALKAQAVAARTFTRYSLTTGKHAGHGFHVCAHVCCQAYGGVSREDPRTTAAVDATAGLIITYNGLPIQAFYHAASGGHTENSENVWSGARPYLTGVPDFDQQFPRYNWEVAFTAAEVASKLRAYGIDVGTLHNITVSGRGVSGRAIDVVVTGAGGEITIRSTALRFALGLDSTLFELTVLEPDKRMVVQGWSAGTAKTVIGKDGTVVVMPGAVIAVGADGIRHRLDSAAVVSSREMAGSFTFTGRGWGHGVGMSQWGARELALRGHDFQHILKYYYQGVDIAPW